MIATKQSQQLLQVPRHVLLVLVLRNEFDEFGCGAAVWRGSTSINDGGAGCNAGLVPAIPAVDVVHDAVDLLQIDGLWCRMLKGLTCPVQVTLATEVEGVIT